MATECGSGKILNPKTKRCVNRDGPTGRKIVADESRKSASRKSRSRKSRSRKSASRKSASRKSASRKSASRKSASRKSASRKSASRKSKSDVCVCKTELDSMRDEIDILKYVCGELSEKADLRFDRETTDYLTRW
jgi:hypothetical protein